MERRTAHPTTEIQPYSSLLLTVHAEAMIVSLSESLRAYLEVFLSPGEPPRSDSLAFAFDYEPILETRRVLKSSNDLMGGIFNPSFVFLIIFPILFLCPSFESNTHLTIECLNKKALFLLALSENPSFRYISLSPNHKSSSAILESGIGLKSGRPPEMEVFWKLDDGSDWPVYKMRYPSYNGTGTKELRLEWNHEPWKISCAQTIAIIRSYIDNPKRDFRDGPDKLCFNTVQPEFCVIQKQEERILLDGDGTEPRERFTPIKVQFCSKAHRLREEGIEAYIYTDRETRKYIPTIPVQWQIATSNGRSRNKVYKNRVAWPPGASATEAPWAPGEEQQETTREASPPPPVSVSLE